MNAPENDPDVYRLVFEQTPPLLRWILGFLTLGVFTLIGMIWRRQERQVKHVEAELHRRMDREMSEIYHRLDRMYELQTNMNDTLVRIAFNTRNGA